MFEKKEFYSFVEEDPFNPGNKMEGDLSTSRKGKDDLYGAIYVRAVNGEKVEPYLIRGTPKLRYPFDKGGGYQFPSASEIRSYLKYDGTNVYAYKYYDAKGNEFISFKVRLFPFIGKKYLPMWKKMLAKYPIKQIFGLNPHLSGFSFELYGHLNPHLIKYDVDLDTVLLFGRDKQGDIVPNEQIKTIVPKAPLQTTVSRDYVWYYQEMQEQLGKNLILTEEINPETDEPLYTGDEGYMWYLRTKDTDKWMMIKCKPHEIEKIHWAAVESKLIEKPVLRATMINILETHDRLTLDVVNEYLSEEFTQIQISASSERIVNMISGYEDFVNQRLEIQELIIKHNIDLDQELSDIMKEIKPLISKRQSRTAYLAAQYLIRLRDIKD